VTLGDFKCGTRQSPNLGDFAMHVLQNRSATGSGSMLSFDRNPLELSARDHLEAAV
jgi:hypothetical protein